MEKPRVAESLSESATSSLNLKNAVLIALAVQQAGLVLVIRYSKMQEGGAKKYVNSTAVVSAECFKIVLNVSIGLFVLANRSRRYSKLDSGTDQSQTEEASVPSTTSQASSQLSYTQTFTKLMKLIFHCDSVHMAVPALLYVIQNNLLFVALANLSVPVYQITNQGKLLTTAICSRIFLNRKLSWLQYLSLIILATGVALVQLSGRSNSSNNNSTSTPSLESQTQLIGLGAAIREMNSSNSNSTSTSSLESQTQLIGLGAVLLSCFTSSVAGVYFEKVVKSSGGSKSNSNDDDEGTKACAVFVRNTQLALWSILMGLIPVLTSDLHVIQKNGGFFQGYNSVVLVVIVCQGLTGLLVGLVMKYADAVLKGFSTSVAVVLATLASFLIWPNHVTLDAFFLLGASLVMSSVRLYSNHKNLEQLLCHQLSSVIGRQEEDDGAKGDKKRGQYHRLCVFLTAGASIFLFWEMRFFARITNQPSAMNRNPVQITNQSSIVSS
eukprot:CAMPEP_0197466872 /NCGR_PEP_ID=MMETSP1175-20131217/65275_1 /TAXON_ID=1003142 /ORGANISM="Triceratium dubium, Strain CCMP147" /LENGTH=494 /DNA_ID=CAMNT_0043002927 /DNA_START=1 /DNA_END=1483 /DNA_ORIENTATION=+